MPPCCPPLALKAVINHSTQKAPLALLRIWSAEIYFRFSPQRHAAVLPTTGPQSCDESQHSKSSADALEYGVRKFISAFLRCVVPKQANKDTAGDEPNVFTSLAEAYAECGCYEEAVRTAKKAELFEPREAIPGVRF